MAPETFNEKCVVMILPRPISALLVVCHLAVCHLGICHLGVWSLAKCQAHWQTAKCQAPNVQVANSQAANDPKCTNGPWYDSPRVVTLSYFLFVYDFCSQHNKTAAVVMTSTCVGSARAEDKHAHFSPAQ